MGLQLAKDFQFKDVQVFVDSLLLTNHYNGSYVVKGKKLALYLEILKKLAFDFENFSLTLVPREENIEADALANLGSPLRIPPVMEIPITHIITPAIKTLFDKSEAPKRPKGIAITEDPDPRILPRIDPDKQDPQRSLRSWTQPIMEYLQNGTIPTGEKSERAFKTRVSIFVLIQGKLYKKSMTGPHLRCLEDPEAAKVLKDIHEGDCGNHTGGRSLCSKILRTGYY
ncbi:uncharacterized protein LOC128127793 [Lactuca sativa]|uniref:uncharacterized protein LOC128127793 n=1 Tax=Lactuca sativa TaxID=4236 RepID=UPI0022AFCAB2|nr:uncharacterized protein LOC128127793 [Lactuca sativa]